MNELQYRVNFVVQLFQSLIALGVGLVVLALVYSHTDELNGWSQSELLCVLGIQILMGGAIKTFIQPNMTRLMDEVREGKLDYALTKPEDAQLLVSVREVRIWQAVDLFSGAIRPGRRRVGAHDERGRARRARLRGRARARRVMIYCFWLAITTGAFWVVRMERSPSSSTASSRPAVGRSASIRVASLQRDVPGPDRLRRHRSRRGADVTARLVDPCLRGGCSPLCSSRAHAGSGASASAGTPAPPPEHV